MKSKLVLFFILLAVTATSQAQDTVRRFFDTGKLDTISSGILKEKRLIQVFVPATYKPGSKDKYDVLYVLDGGNWNTGLIMKVQHFLEDEKYMPPIIVVSILGIDRNKDLTPTHIRDWNTSGGADKFLGFIKEELIPHINSNYPSSGDNALWGHSLGGLFVINALLQAPQTFKSYIAADPSLWWDNCYIQGIAPDKLPALAGRPTTLFISGRAGNEGKNMKIDSMDAVLKKMAPADLSWKSIPYPDETHSSIRLKTIYDGLKFSYGWHDGQLEFHPENGIIIKNQPLKVWFFSDTTAVRYTLNGTVPERTAATISPEITLTDATTLYIKQFTNRARYDKLRSGNFTAGKAMTPVSRPVGVRPGGFHYAYYEVPWDTLQSLKSLQPQQTGILSPGFENKLPRKKNYALLIDGLLETQEEGYYIFALDADAGSKLYLNNQLLIRWEGSASKRTTSYILPLKKGFYQLRLEYLRKQEDLHLKLGYVTPRNLQEKKVIPVPPDLQYSTQ
ncbi:alpha/beta hydrolase-fold protein [Chitinophaga solisilvae]|uniref:alpha/beta hydrolase-fold protein n=1 Tax=Chitinophaga solisilvae TaxID=1233460 RepID=UPI0013690B82|nr:alpha/beta hydrolase-fold protein [Chitinophaga solisilvae]